MTSTQFSTQQSFQRKRFIEMLHRKHTETMRKYSQFQTADDENEAYEMWRERRERESKRRKVEPQQHRMPCPACAAHGWYVVWSRE